MIRGVGYLIDIDKLSRERESFTGGILGWPPSTSLEKLPLPDKLNQDQPVVNLENESPQPEP